MFHLAVATMVFYVLHSLLATDRLKARAAKVLGSAHHYRLVYSVISTMLAVWVVATYLDCEGDRLWHLHPVLLVAGTSLLIAGAGLVMLAISLTGASGFFGLRAERTTSLIRTGLYARLRHPIYAGILLAALGWILLAATPPTILVCLITFIYLPIGIRHEETRLIRAFGDTYLTYRKEVPAILPRW